MIYVLVPSYNDSENIPNLLENISKSLKSKNFEVIIVDDGSTDGTKEMLNNLRLLSGSLRILGYKQNKGPGFALNYGFLYILKKAKESDVIITMEADNTADLKLISKMLKKLKHYDVILASPHANGGGFIGLEIKRKALSIISNFLDKKIFRVPNVTTYTSFFRAYRIPALLKVKRKYKGNLMNENGFPSVVEILIKLHNEGASFQELPSIVDWTKRKGKSHMNVNKTIIRHLLIYKDYIQGHYKK